MNAKDVESEIPHWDLGRDVAQTVKSQIDLLLNYIIKSVKNKEESRNRYLLPLKYLLCYVENSGLQDILKMDVDQEAKFALLLRKQMGESNNLLHSVGKYYFWKRKRLTGKLMCGMWRN